MVDVEKSFLIKDARAITLIPARIQRCDLRISKGLIQEIEENLVPTAGEIVHDLHGKVLLPGFVCAHTHLYSSLARGMPGPEKSPRNFPEILEKIWWRLDRALDEESIYASALIGGLEALRFGTTTLIDHHASPNFIDGSLDLIDDALAKVGVRRVLCYETTDRGGMERRDAGLAENERFLKKSATPMSAGLVGAHAAFTLSDESLEKCGDLARRLDTGVHIHVAEDTSDNENARQNQGSGVIDRLDRFGVLTPKSLFAHNIHLTPEELSQAREGDVWLLHNPRSNMNNGVGQAAIGDFGRRSALGTDGFPADMIEESKIAFYKSQDNHVGATAQDILALLHQGHDLAGELLGLPFGRLEKGSAADLLVLDYWAPTPMNEDNLVGHMLFGLHGAQIESVIVAGDWVIRNRIWQHLDVVPLYEEAAAVAQGLWQRMREID